MSDRTADAVSDFSRDFRHAATATGLIGGLLVGLTTTLIGGSWLAMPACGAVGMLIGQIVPIESSRGRIRNGLIRVLRGTRGLPFVVRLAFAVLLLAAVSAIDIAETSLNLAMQFYLFVLPIVLSAVLFGWRTALVTTLLCIVAVVYFAIPPRQSFAILSIWDGICVGAFVLMALITFASVNIQSGFAAIDEDQDSLLYE